MLIPFRDFFNRKTIKTSLSKIAAMINSQHAISHTKNPRNRGVSTNYETTITHKNKDEKNPEFYDVRVAKNGRRFEAPGTETPEAPEAPEIHLTSGQYSPEDFYRGVLKLHGITNPEEDRIGKTNKVKRPQKFTPNDNSEITITTRQRKS